MSKVHPFVITIDERIAGLEKEIARLTIARSVVLELDPPQRMTWKNITPPNTGGVAKMGKIKKLRKAKTAERHAISGLVLDALRNIGPLSSHDIWTHINERSNTPVEKKPMWNAIWVMKSHGDVVKDGNFYRLPTDAELLAE